MNAVGKIGEFIIKYQYPIEIALLVILAVIVLYALVRAIVKTKREKNVLSQINSTVSDINTTVSSINDKQTVRAAKDTGKSKNSISVSKDIPSVKVSYVVSDDDRDHQTTVSIDHEYIPENHASSGEAAYSKAVADDKDLDSVACSDDVKASALAKAVKNDEAIESMQEKSEEAQAEKPGALSVYEGLRSTDSEEVIEALIRDTKKQESEIAGHRKSVETPKVYMNRDCAIDKFGNVYTEEQLSEQIK